MAKPSSLWEGDGKTKPYLDEVKPDSKEWKGIEDHLWHLGGSEVQGLEILKIERNENWHLFSQYRSYRNGLDDEGNEKYLFHGSPSATHEIMDEGKGLDTAYASQEFNVYGVGNYFAPDLRLSLSFIRAQPGQAREILLCRVACGRVGERDRVAPQGASRQQWRGALILTQNELAPEGCQSATSRHRKELVVYKQNHAYPAYRITLRYTDDPRDPYESPSLFNELRVLEDVPYPKLSRSRRHSRRYSGYPAQSSSSIPRPLSAPGQAARPSPSQTLTAQTLQQLQSSLQQPRRRSMRYTSNNGDNYHVEVQQLPGSSLMISINSASSGRSSARQQVSDSFSSDPCLFGPRFF